MRSDWWKFNESVTSGTRPPVRYIRRGEEGVRASDLDRLRIRLVCQGIGSAVCQKRLGTLTTLW